MHHFQYFHFLNALVLFSSFEYLLINPYKKTANPNNIGNHSVEINVPDQAK